MDNDAVDAMFGRIMEKIEALEAKIRFDAGQNVQSMEVVHMCRGALSAVMTIKQELEHELEATVLLRKVPTAPLEEKFEEEPEEAPDYPKAVF